MSDPETSRLQLENAILRSASGRFHDPDDAVLNLRNADVITGDGTIDQQALDQAITDLLTRKPHLARRHGPQPSLGAVRHTVTSNERDERVWQQVLRDRGLRSA